MKYTDLNIEDRQNILRRVQSETGKGPQIVEKDWWVVKVENVTIKIISRVTQLINSCFT